MDTWLTLTLLLMTLGGQSLGAPSLEYLILKDRPTLKDRQPISKALGYPIVRKGKILRRSAPDLDLTLAANNIYLTQELTFDLKSYQRSSEQPSCLKLSPSKYRSEYLGYLNNFLYQNTVSPQIKNNAAKVKGLLSQVVREIPYQGQVTQPAMLNVSLAFNVRLLSSLDPKLVIN